jgi:hypothetical protein
MCVNLHAVVTKGPSVYSCGLGKTVDSIIIIIYFIFIWKLNQQVGQFCHEKNPFFSWCIFSWLGVNNHMFVVYLYVHSGWFAYITDIAHWYMIFQTRKISNCYSVCWLFCYCIAHVLITVMMYEIFLIIMHSYMVWTMGNVKSSLKIIAKTLN